MLQHPTKQTPDIVDVTTTVAQCEEILATIGSLATAEAYQELYDDLVKRAEGPLSPAERSLLEETIDKVRAAWWREKCRASSGAATFRTVAVHSSQLHTGP